MFYVLSPLKLRPYGGIEYGKCIIIIMC